ncbi:hypothetical protein [Treponema sp. R6D11]
MSERIYEETAVIIKQKHSVRLLEYKENGIEFTEINVYSKEVTEKDDEIADYFVFGFTVKGKGDEEREKIEKMNERDFEEFVRHMTLFLEKKYNIVHKKEEKKEEDKKPVINSKDADNSIEDFEVPSGYENL